MSSLAKDQGFVFCPATQIYPHTFVYRYLGVAELLPFNSRIGTYSGNVDTLHRTVGVGMSIWTILGASTNSPSGDSVGGLLVNFSRYHIENQYSVVLQFFISAKPGSVMKSRSIHFVKETNQETFSDWL